MELDGGAAQSTSQGSDSSAQVPSHSGISTHQTSPSPLETAPCDDELPSPPEQPPSSPTEAAPSIEASAQPFPSDEPAEEANRTSTPFDDENKTAATPEPPLPEEQIPQVTPTQIIVEPPAVSENSNPEAASNSLPRTLRSPVLKRQPSSEAGVSASCC